MKKLNLFALGMISLSLVSCGGETTEETTEEVVVETYALDLEVSKINWTGEYYKAGAFDHNHMGFVNFNSGSIDVAEGVIQSGAFELDMNSIDEPNAPMGEEMRAEFVGHLKSEDYFDVAKHPKAVVRLENCTAKSLKGVVIVKGVEMPFDVPATISIGETESKITGEFNLNFAPFKMEGIGSKADPEYVSPEVKFNLVLKFKK